MVFKGGKLAFHMASRDVNWFIWRIKSSLKSPTHSPLLSNSMLGALAQGMHDIMSARISQAELTWQTASTLQWLHMKIHCMLPLNIHYRLLVVWHLVFSLWGSLPSAKLLTARKRKGPVTHPMSDWCHSHSHLIGPCKSHAINCLKQYKPQVQKISQLSLVNNTKSHPKHCTHTCALWHGLQDQIMLTSLELQGTGVQFPLHTNITPKSELLTIIRICNSVRSVCIQSKVQD